METNKNKTENKVEVQLIGCGLRDRDNTISGIDVIERSFEFSDPVEFGKFLGPSDISRRVQSERDIIVPSKLRRTWSIKRIRNIDKETYLDWAEMFSESNIGSKDLNKQEILLYWLQRTGDEKIVDILSNEL